MLQHELDGLTKMKSTYEEYEDINRLYMTSNTMTKHDAAKIYKMVYGERAKVRMAEANRPFCFDNESDNRDIFSAMKVRIGVEFGSSKMYKAGTYKVRNRLVKVIYDDLFMEWKFYDVTDKNF